MNKPSVSRRELLLKSVAAIPVISFVSFRSQKSVSAEDLPLAVLKGFKNRLIVQTESPFNAETPLDRLGDDWITPVEDFYVRSNGEVPLLNAKDFVLTVDGMVERPLAIKIADLVDKLPPSNTTATLTCAGNRRTEFEKTSKKASGLQWVSGAMGNAEWTGVRLSDVLKLAGIGSSAKHVWFEGVDKVTEKTETIPFVGSIPVEKAMADTPIAPGALLATHMNGQVLRPEHGFPIRSVVPGFIGARSVKWLGKITLSDRPSPNPFVSKSYKVVAEDTPASYAAAGPIYEQCLNSMITSPQANAEVSNDRLTVRGIAIAAGHSGRSIKLVEASVDGGKSWQTAKVTSPIREFCWVHWSIHLNVGPDTKSILVRATDSSGETQPQQVPWNAKGYQYNSWHKIDIKRG